MITVQLTVICLQQLQNKLDTLNRRARRLRCGECTMRIISRQPAERSVYVIDMDSPRRDRVLIGTETVETTTVEIEYPEEPVALAGWSFVARLSPLEGGGNIVAGGEIRSCPEEYFNAPIACDHCRSNRDRKDTFVVRHTDGTHRQIGRNCLRDFIGDANAESTAKFFEFVAERTEILRDYEFAESEFWEGRAGIGERTYDLEAVIATALAVSPQYVSRSRAEETGGHPTSELTRIAIGDGFHPEDKHRAEAESIIADTIATVPAETSDSYQHNIRALAVAGYCTSRTMGIAVSMIPAYRRRVADRDREERGKRSQHVGRVGERIIIEGVIVGTWDKEGYFGRRVTITTLCFIRDDNDNMFVANNVGSRGERIRIKATVSEHSEYRGVLQTKLSRPVKLAELTA